MISFAPNESEPLQALINAGNDLKPDRSANNPDNEFPKPLLTCCSTRHRIAFDKGQKTVP